MTTLHMQYKMTNTMTMQEQMEMLGLELTTLVPLQWNSTNQWSPLLGGGWSFEACMILVSGSGENDAARKPLLSLVEIHCIVKSILSLYGIHPPKDGEMGPT